MAKIWAQVKKEWIEFRRDKLSLSLAFLLPLLSLLLFGYGIQLESNKINVAIDDQDRTSISREYIYRLFATNIFVPAKNSDRSPIDAIDRGDAKVGIIIPHGFTTSIFRGQAAPMQVMIDGTDISNAQIVFNSIKAANLYFTALIKAEKSPLANLQIVKPHVRVWFNPGLQERLFIVPGAFGVILWMYPALLAAVAISREKEEQTITRVYSSKISALEFLLGKMLIYVCVGICMAILITTLGWILFGLLPIADPTPLLVAIPIYIMVSVAFGLFLGAYTNSQTVAVQATSTGGFFPCLLLSGFVYPINNIPFPLNCLAAIVPARYFIDVSRDAFVRGVGWPAVWQDPLILSLFVGVLLAGSWFGLRRMQVNN